MFELSKANINKRITIFPGLALVVFFVVDFFYIVLIKHRPTICRTSLLIYISYNLYSSLGTLSRR